MLSFLSRISTRIVALAMLALGLSIALTLVLQSQMRQTAETLRDHELLKITEIGISLLEDLNAGIASGDYTKEEAQEVGRQRLTALKFGESGYIYAFDQDYIVQVHPYRPNWIGTNQKDIEDVNGVRIYEELKEIAERDGHGSVTYHFTKPDTDVQEAKVGYAYLYEPWGWIIGTGAYVSDIEAELATIRQKALIVLAVTLVVLGAASVFLIRSVTRPMGTLSTRMNDLAEGDTEGEIPFTATQNELGDMARTVGVFRDALVRQKELEEEQKRRDAAQSEVVGTLSSHLSRLSQGDLSAKIVEAFPSHYEALRTDFNSSITTLSQTMTEVVESARSIRNGAEEISQASDDLSKRTESQAATLEETAAALDDMTGSVKSAATGARDVEAAIAAAQSEAEASEEVVGDAVRAMNEIAQSSSQISQIVSVIDDIAFQTNLLALNAGVEAARAGDAGRGFAVVASEVRNLAHSSSEAAMEIKNLIDESAKQVEQGVELVGKGGTSFKSIVTRVAEISRMVSNIAEGAVEQSTGIGEINAGVSQLDNVTQKNAAMVEEATAAGHLLKSDAARLVDLVNNFDLGTVQTRRPAVNVELPSAKPEAKSEVKSEAKPATKPAAEPKPAATQEAPKPAAAKPAAPKPAAPKPAAAQPAPQQSAIVFDDGSAAADIWAEF